jgi:hypothetical protein
MKRKSNLIKGTAYLILAILLALTIVTPYQVADGLAHLMPQAAYAQIEPTPVDPATLEDAEPGGEAVSPAAAENSSDSATGEAQTPSDEDGPKEAINEEDVIQRIAQAATIVHRFFAPLINFFAFQIGNFLGNDYIFEGPMGQMLQKIWVITRNLVNIAFVFILLGMALKEIFYVGGEPGELRKNLVKFALLMIAVNFTWLGAKVVLDAANVVTNAVFAIPSGVSSIGVQFKECQVNDDPSQPISGLCIPSEIYAPLDSLEKAPLNYKAEECEKVGEGYDQAYPDGEPDANVSEENKKYLGTSSICWENLNLFKYDQNTAVVYLTYGMARIQNLVYSNQGDVSELGQLAVGTLMSLVIQIAYTISLLALWIALIIRMVFLWIFVAFSPALVLVIYFSGFSDQDFGEVKFGVREFLNWAFVPAYVGAIFSVAFLMLAAGQSLGGTEVSVIDNLNQAGVTGKLLRIKSLFLGMDSLQEFIWLLLTLVVMWMGTFSVLNKMPVLGTITRKIDEYGQQTAKLLGTAPYWAPMVPMVGKDGEKTSVREMLKGVSPMHQLYEEKYKHQEAAPSKTVEFSKQAKTVNANQINRLVTRYQGTSDAATKRNIAEKIAKEYGSTPHELMRLDKSTLMEGFKHKNAENADKIYKILEENKERRGGLPGVTPRSKQAEAEKAPPSATPPEPKPEDPNPEDTRTN